MSRHMKWLTSSQASSLVNLTKPRQKCGTRRDFADLADPYLLV